MNGLPSHSKTLSLEGFTTPPFLYLHHPHNSRPNPANAAALRRHEDAATNPLQTISSRYHRLVISARESDHIIFMDNDFSHTYSRFGLVHELNALRMGHEP